MKLLSSATLLAAVLATVVCVLVLFAPTNSAHAQNSYGLNELLRDVRSGLEKGMTRGSDSRKAKGPPLPVANPKRAERAKIPEEARSAQFMNDLRQPKVTAEAPAAPESAQASPEVSPPPDSEVELVAEAPLPLPLRNPVRTGEMKLPPPHPRDIEAEPWSKDQIAQAKATCGKLMKQGAFSYTALEPLREGVCGTPAPIKLKSVDAGGKVVLSPAPTITCDLAANLRHWLNDVVQPAAKAHLGERIVKLRVMSHYSCRNTYNNAYNRLSHHALANALDIGGLETAKGERVVLLDHWNQLVAAPELEPESEPDEAAVDEKAQPLNADTQAAKSKAPSGPAAISGVTKPDPKNELPPVSRAAPKNPASPTKKPEPDAKSQNGAPPAEANAKQAEAKAIEEEKKPPVMVPGPKRLFLRTLHKGACGIFGTTMGPEADKAHRNHFHFDAKGRRNSYCR